MNDRKLHNATNRTRNAVDRALGMVFISLTCRYEISRWTNRCVNAGTASEPSEHCAARWMDGNIPWWDPFSYVHPQCCSQCSAQLDACRCFEGWRIGSQTDWHTYTHVRMGLDKSPESARFAAHFDSVHVWNGSGIWCMWRGNGLPILL